MHACMIWLMTMNVHDRVCMHACMHDIYEKGMVCDCEKGGGGVL